jgi:hypothetical protein
MTRAGLAATLLFALGCGGGQTAEAGTEALLQMKHGTFFRGSLPTDYGGPSVEAAFLGQTQFPARFQGKSFNGALSPNATAVAIALEGDVGYWSVPAGQPMAETPDLPSFDAALSFAATVPAGPHVLELAAVDAENRFGAHKTVPLTLSPLPLPQGPLVFSLFWDTASDLDLHVVLPDGVEIDKDNVNSWRATGVTDDLEAFRSGGLLDFDSNAQCRIDRRNNENVAWSVEPPAGNYVVRVETYSLCGEAAARWSVEARYQGDRIALSTGVSLPTDTRPSTSAASGVTAFELWVH